MSSYGKGLFKTSMNISELQRKNLLSVLLKYLEKPMLSISTTISQAIDLFIHSFIFNFIYYYLIH